MCVLAMVAGVCVAAGACSSGDKTNASDGNAGDYSAGAAPTLGPKPGGSCANFFKTKNQCGACAEDKCCPVLTECNAAKGCQECLEGNPATCEQNKVILEKLANCAQSQCSDVCKPAGPPPAPACDAALVAPSGGTCVKQGPKAACNPVSNSGCDTAKGESCDIGQNGFQCYPGPNTVSLCSECGQDKGQCSGGLTCIGKCAKYCCSDGDCGTGKCDKSIMNDPDLPIGLCVAR
jgi:hypothetical protein